MSVIFFLAMLIAAVGALIAVFAKDEAKTGGVLIAVIFGLLGAVMGVTVVDARAVGVQTSTGKYRGTLGPGLSYTAPWSSIEEWTTRLQTSTFTNGKEDERDNFHREGCIKVKLYAEQPACVDATVEWGVTEKSVKTLWESYKDFETARKNYVNTEIRAQVAAAFEGYDPLLKVRDPEADPTRGAYDQFSRVADGKLRPLFEGRGLQLKAVRVTNIDYPDSVDQLLNNLGVSVARTGLAAQDVETAKKEAEAARERNNPAVVVPGCEALIRDLAAKDQLKNLPDGWQCPGGPPAGVIVGGRPR